MTARRAKAESPKVCLVMIVRDEEAIIRERLEAVRGEIDWWCIVDTGSVDGTKRIVGEVLGEIPGVLLDHPWAGFADARTFAVERAAALGYEGSWALLLDADTVFGSMAGWKVALTSPADYLECEVHHGAIRYSHPRLLKLGAQTWRWRGVLHEYLAIPFGSKGAACDLIWVEHGSGGARSKDPRKFRKDAELLRSTREAMALHPDGDDADLLPRYAFYEAQSWRDAGSLVEAEAAYVERTKLGGYAQEVYISWLNVGELRLGDGELAGAAEAWTRAWAVDPGRAEALIGLATIARSEELWAPAFHYGWLAYVAAYSGKDPGMFADVNRKWRADFEISVAGWYCGHKWEGRRACERVLKNELAPENVKATTRANLALYR
jgi:glycosyltransferase involved in cell wall biosynthesis